MNAAVLPISGAAMDRVLRRRGVAAWLPGGGWRPWAAAALALAAAAVAAWRLWPAGLPVARADVSLATVRAGQFHDVLASRVTVVPESSVMLDATEGGRVEAVLVRDGAAVAPGELLFRLSNPQRAQDVMARSADMAQQLANLATLRAQLAAARLAHRRDLAALQFETERQDRLHRRNEALAGQGFLSAVALEDSADRLRQQQRQLDLLRADGEAELAIRAQSVQEMERATAGLGEQLRLTRASADALDVRAPAAGRLTGFALQQGASVKPGERVGRIDSSQRFKLAARIDEFYLPRIAIGLKGTLAHQDQALEVSVARIDPQVTEGRFGIELVFDGAPPATLQAGQTLDARIVLGRPGAALLLDDGPFLADTGGGWAFVLTPDGRHAERRAISLGRRAAGTIEVLSGLRAGEQVVVSGVRHFGDAQRLCLEP